MHGGSLSLDDGHGFAECCAQPPQPYEQKPNVQKTSQELLMLMQAWRAHSPKAPPARRAWRRPPRACAPSPPWQHPPSPSPQPPSAPCPSPCAHPPAVCQTSHLTYSVSLAIVLHQPIQSASSRSSSWQEYALHSRSAGAHREQGGLQHARYRCHSAQGQQVPPASAACARTPPPGRPGGSGTCSREQPLLKYHCILRSCM